MNRLSAKLPSVVGAHAASRVFCRELDDAAHILSGWDALTPGEKSQAAPRISDLVDALPADAFEVFQRALDARLARIAGGQP